MISAHISVSTSHVETSNSHFVTDINLDWDLIWIHFTEQIKLQRMVTSFHPAPTAPVPLVSVTTAQHRPSLLTLLVDYRRNIIVVKIRREMGSADGGVAW